jgi:hypothetical protein
MILFFEFLFIFSAIGGSAYGGEFFVFWKIGSTIPSRYFQSCTKSDF